MRAGLPLSRCRRLGCCSVSGRGPACPDGVGAEGEAGMNGFSTEEDSRDGPPAPAAPFFGQTCCLIDGGERCARPAGNASFSKRVQKSISQKRLKLDIDKSLQVNTLRRYKRHYKLQTRPGLNKAQLAETVSRHFRNIPVNEKETLAYFIYMVKNNRSRLDQKSESSKQLDA
ncbi:PREDICTED: histone deacetylase complex subunit SAP30L isoform X3 [Nanorana parkeri]|uniref:histone deacetylase complex subunit SAP30L isoform X3 n=1 Tax=Nanorana parkeri TaxID=125878 RepID=UPI000854148A|nr:PREDICTED: histone deacetylase complex subunit SAP30L isoform X3 [Nanorana parkeri]